MVNKFRIQQIMRETSLGARLDILPGIANGAMLQSQAVTIAI